VLRLLLWRMLGLIAALGAASLLAWFLGGGPGRLLRGAPGARGVRLSLAGLASTALADARGAWAWAPVSWLAPVQALALLAAVTAFALAISRASFRSRRRYVRMRVEPYRGDHADADALVRMFDSVEFLDSPGARAAEGGEQTAETRENELVF
jgi:hypothetical protein